MKVFLDIDGVLLGNDPTRPSRLGLAAHALDLLTFVLARAEVHWLSPRCRGDARAAVDHLVLHTPPSDRERLLTLAQRVRATDYHDHRAEALPADGNFVWLDDEPSPAELAALRARGWLERWLWVDTREEPDDLRRALQVLGKRLGGAATKAAASRDTTC
ncbi:MAG: hypothetical protein JNN13_13020 [Planctomycetes bacterium]|nr:hypothetical protein [Planctomycetota bacterium]